MRRKLKPDQSGHQVSWNIWHVSTLRWFLDVLASLQSILFTHWLSYSEDNLSLSSVLAKMYYFCNLEFRIVPSWFRKLSVTHDPGQAYLSPNQIVIWSCFCFCFCFCICQTQPKYQQILRRQCCLIYFWPKKEKELAKLIVHYKSFQTVQALGISRSLLCKGSFTKSSSDFSFHSFTSPVPLHSRENCIYFLQIQKFGVLWRPLKNHIIPLLLSMQWRVDISIAFH